MPYVNRKPTYGNFILIFVALKLLFNLFAINHYGFQRDEFLHLVLGDHLSWGYKEVPPFIGLLAWIVNQLLGASLIATRVFPTVFACLLVWTTGKLVVEMGGKRLAITIACLTLIFSPAFAASDYLFQPVIFDQFWWAIAALLLVKYVNTKENKYLYYLGAAVGLGILTKYTMIFFAAALVVGLLISKHRKLILTKPFLLSSLIVFVIILPNVIWQLTHHIPAISHMGKLQKYQLDYNKPAEFAIQQFLVHGMGLLVWLPGLICLFSSYKLRRFMFLGIAYLVVFAFLMKMHGKHYYLFPAYPMLFAAGALVIERLLKSVWRPLRVVAVMALVLPNLIFFPLTLPFLSLQQTVDYISVMREKMPVINFAVTWEDKKQHPLTQDYADMLGWEEMVQITSKAFHALPAAEQKQTVIFTDNYGEAGAFLHYQSAYQLPAILSLNSSFALWAPPEIAAENMFYISDDHDVSDLIPYSTSIEKVGEVSNPLAREKGTAVFLIRGLKPGLKKIYADHLKQSLEN